MRSWWGLVITGLVCLTVGVYLGWSAFSLNYGGALNPLEFLPPW